MDSEQIGAAVTIDLPRLQMREVLAGRWRCCFNCDNLFDQDEGTCNLYKVKPPLEVSTVGCSSWATKVPF